MRLQLDEESVRVREDVRGACEILGFDPFCVADEGRAVVTLKSRIGTARILGMFGGEQLPRIC